MLQGPNAPFVARAAGLDALANPDLFFGQPLIEQRILLFLGRQGVGLAQQERVVIARPIEQPAAIDLQNARGQVLQKHAIVRHEYQRRAASGQELFQPDDRFHVEMVRRLVEQQHVGSGNQRPGQ